MYDKANVWLLAQSIGLKDGEVYPFEVDAFRKHCLLNGLDDIGLTMQQQDKIKVFEAKHKQVY